MNMGFLPTYCEPFGACATAVRASSKPAVSQTISWWVLDFARAVLCYTLHNFYGQNFLVQPSGERLPFWWPHDLISAFCR